MIEYERLIKSIAFKLYSKNRFYSIDDLVQVGWMTALRINDIYDTSKSKKTSFLTLCVQRDMVHFIKKFNKNHLSNTITYEEAKSVEEITDGLTEIQKSVANLLICGYKKKEISEHLNISIRALAKIIDQIGAKINA